MEQKPISSSPFAVDPKKSTVADRMYAMYAILRSHEVAQEKHCKLPLTETAKRGFRMSTWDCGTAACAAGSAGLIPWFQELAKFEGIEVKPHPDKSLGRMGIMAPENFVDRAAIWSYVHSDMHGLFLGMKDIYKDIPGVKQDNGRQVALSELTAQQVKEALRKIIIKHFGEAGAERCKELDQNCILTD